MKTLLFALCLLSFLLFSNCQSNDQAHTAPQITGKWRLIKLEHGWTGKTILAQTLPYQEIYEFNADNTFRKYRTDGWVATGTYAKKQLEEQNYFEAAFEKQDLSSGCTAGKAYLQQLESDLLIEDNLACDGPKLYYQRVKDEEEKQGVTPAIR